MPALDLIDVSERFGQVPRLMTTCVEEAVNAMSERYRPHRLTVLSGDRVDIDFSHQAVALDGASINILRYGPDVVIDAGDFDYFYMLEMPLAGGVDLRLRSDAARRSGVRVRDPLLAHAPAHAGSAVSAESLWDLSDGSPGRRLGPDRRGHAEGGG
jgi:hypothetical protein